MNLLVGGESHHCITERKDYVVKSLADDIMYNISNGQFLTLNMEIISRCFKALLIRLRNSLRIQLSFYQD